MPLSAFVHTRNRTAAGESGTVARLRRGGAHYGRVGTAVAALCVTVFAAGCSDTTGDDAIVRTTTNIAGAGVVGLERDTTRSCALPSAPDSASGDTRDVTHANGVSEVPADAQRIVVLDTSALDAVCAVGLWERVVGTTTLDGPATQPDYLGYGVLDIPSVGTTAQPDVAKIADLHPDLILGETPTDSASYDALSDIAPTVLVGTNPNWQAEFDAYAAGLNRSDAAETALRNYHTEADDAGKALASNQTQASVLRFTNVEPIRAQGTDSFAGQVLADAGVQRPTAQRGPSFDINEGEYADMAEGDLIYVIFAGDEGKEHGEAVLHSDEWEELGASSDKRVFAVDDTIWHGNGLVAARALLTDLNSSLNQFVTD